MFTSYLSLPTLPKIISFHECSVMLERVRVSVIPSDGRRLGIHGRDVPRLFSVTIIRKIIRSRSLRPAIPVKIRVFVWKNYENTVVEARFRSILIDETPVLTYGHSLYRDRQIHGAQVL